MNNSLLSRPMSAIGGMERRRGSGKRGSSERLRTRQDPCHYCPGWNKHKIVHSNLTWLRNTSHRHTHIQKHGHQQTHTCIHMHTHTRQNANHNTSWFCLHSLSANENIHGIREAKGIIQCCVCTLDSVSYGCCVCVCVYRGWAAVASASLVAKRAALPKLYLKPERTALWMGKGDHQNMDWTSGSEKPELGAPYTECACMPICAQHTNTPKERGKQIDGRPYGEDGSGLAWWARHRSATVSFSFRLRSKTCTSQSQPMLAENVTLSEAN